LVGVVLGTALLAAFAFWELREKWPVLEVKLFKNVTFAFSNLAALINYAATYAVSYALSLYLQHVKGDAASLRWICADSTASSPKHWSRPLLATRPTG